ncbi:MAG: LmbE family N-acetylglucosaminyl deacetylase [Halieaceae bacterium]|jgi:LmbE family N-acetylglucosaminyl deacetylase
MIKSIFTFLTIIAAVASYAQQSAWNGAEILKDIQKVGVLNRVLYFAAHPDDENTRLIAYLSKGKNVNTAYFSLTRGDGGQNLIGDEKGPLLGMIRTQELLEARSVDGGLQFFSRAIDFGYSKSPEETFKHWDRQVLLADAVRAIRKFKPDVIVTRFPPDSRAGHGHHTVSAMIAAEAFEAAADETQFLETVKEFGVWKTEKLYWNESSWWNKDIADHKEEYVTLNIGAYDPLLGVSYSEIASVSRSQHQSQGFGMSIQRGDKVEYLRLIHGDSTKKDVLQNHMRSWNDLDGGKIIQNKLEKIIANYEVSYPAKSVDALLDLYFEIQEMPAHIYQQEKAASVKDIIASCAGLWLDFRTEKPLLVVGENFKVTTYAISQSNYEFVLTSVEIGDVEKLMNEKLSNTYFKVETEVSGIKTVSTPYWLAQENDDNTFVVNETKLIGQPENNAVVNAEFTIHTSKGDLIYSRPLMYKWTDRVRGELYRQVNVVEPLSVWFTKKVTLSLNNEIEVRVRANKSAKKIKVQLSWGDSEIKNSDVVTIDSLMDGQSVPVNFSLNGAFESLNSLKVQVWESDQEKFENGLIEIAYPHMQTQVVMPKSELLLIKENIKITRKNIGYIKGSGDEIPVALKEMGCQVTILNPAKMSRKDLQSVDGVIVGIRAYNSIKAMKSAAPILKKYVFDGGFVMVQYNTNRGMVTDELGPYPFKLSRDRVTEENAKVIRLQKDHPILKTPNIITDADFDNWVQERGLYFADEWDPNYTPILGWNDMGEDLKKGSLLVADYGNGQYVFTGISFFRQLPAGVVGAYKLFANLISYGAPITEVTTTK